MYARGEAESVLIFVFIYTGKRVHGVNWIVMWDKIEGTKYENEGFFKK